MINNDVSWYDASLEEEKEINLYNEKKQIEEYNEKFNKLIEKLTAAPGLNIDVIKYLNNNKEEIINLFKLTKILDIFIDLLYELLCLIKINKYKYITQNKECRYSIIDLDTIWIEKEIVIFLQKMSKDLKTAIFIENKLNKQKSIIIVKSSFNKLKQLRLEYKNSRTLSF
jgi:hypothetical protein